MADLPNQRRRRHRVWCRVLLDALGLGSAPAAAREADELDDVPTILTAPPVPWWAGLQRVDVPACERREVPALSPAKAVALAVTGLVFLSPTLLFVAVVATWRPL